MLIMDEAHRRAIQAAMVGCFLCGKPTTLPVIYWMGNLEGTDIFLHPDCAASLTIRLARDVEEYKLRSKKDLKFV